MPFPAKSFTFAAFATVSVLALGTFSSPVHAQNTMKQCADQWNAMKAKNQTGNLTYQQFSKQCMATDDTPAAKPSSSSSTAKPSSTTNAQKPTPASAKNDDEDAGTAKEDLAKCNDGWKDYKAKNNVSGAKAWHVFMAKCLP